MTSNAITITRDDNDRREGIATYHIDGRRISGTVDVRIDISDREPASYRTGPDGLPDDGNPVVWEDVTILVWGDDCELTVNGVVYSGSDSLRMNNRFQSFAYAGSHSMRRRGNWEYPTDAAMRTMRQAFQMIASDYYTPENVYAARVRDAESAVARATGQRDDAQSELDRATATLDATRALRVQI